MDVSAQRFDDLLRALETARHADDELHRHNASLAERVASHDKLSSLRAEIAVARTSMQDAEPSRETR